jgi:subtilisin family serine protease
MSLFSRFGVFIAVLCGIACAQNSNDFYYYQGQKVYLLKDTRITAAKIQASTDPAKFSNLAAEFDLVKRVTSLAGDTVLLSKPTVSSERAASALSPGVATKEIFTVPSFKLGAMTLIVQNEIVVQFKDTVTDACKNALQFPDQHVPAAYQMKLLRAFAVTKTALDATPGLFRVVIGNPNSTMRIANILHGNCAVNFASPNFLIVRPPELESRWKAPPAPTVAGPLSPGLTNIFPNDPYFRRQWNLENRLSDLYGKSNADIRVRGAWDVTQGSDQVRVAVLDDGVDITHPDLASSIARENGAPVQWDAIFDSSDQTPAESDHHGTWVAGVIAAQTHNGIGLSGIAPGVKLVPIRMGSAEDSAGGWTTPTIVYSAIKKAIALRADVINGSWQVGPNDLIESAISSAATAGRNGKGIVMVFAAGNDGGDIVYPASLAKNHPIIAVGATNSWDQIKDSNSNDHEQWESNHGSALTLVAPGVGIITTDLTSNPPENGGSYKEDFNGTSAAAPHVAAAAALLLSIHGDWLAAQIREQLRADATIDSHRSNRIVPGGQSRMSFETKTANLLWIG